MLLAIPMVAGCATTPDDLTQRQIAFYTPACKKLGYTASEEINKCVERKLNENEFFWSSTQDVVTESGNVRTMAPIPPPPPQKNQ
jgi:hypothetical protein